MDPLTFIYNRWRRRKAHRRPTMFGEALIYDTRWHGSRLRVLELDGAYQSATFLDDRWAYPPFPYLHHFDCIFEAGGQIRSVCMIGGGGYAYPKHVVAHHPSTSIDVVEVDQAITDIAFEFFFLDELEKAYHAQRNGRLNLICDDGLSYLKGCAEQGRRYDAILNDCFAGNAADITLATAEAAGLFRRCLNPGGLYATNVISALEGSASDPLWTVVEALGAAFSYVLVFPVFDDAPTKPGNILVIASDSLPSIPRARLVVQTA